jgi:hypothetical protein
MGACSDLATLSLCIQSDGVCNAILKEKASLALLLRIPRCSPQSQIGNFTDGVNIKVRVFNHSQNYIDSNVPVPVTFGL